MPPPKGVQVLMPRSWEHAALCGKRNFVDMIKLRVLRNGRLSWIIQVGPMGTKQKQRLETERKLEVDMLLALKPEEGVLRQSTWKPLEAGKGKKKFLPRGFRRDPARLTPQF